jgi:hypothetical protein
MELNWMITSQNNVSLIVKNTGCENKEGRNVKLVLGSQLTFWLCMILLIQEVVC